MNANVELAKEVRIKSGCPYPASAWADRWKAIDFRKAEHQVNRLQKRITAALNRGDFDAAFALIHKMIHSFYAKALAVKTVSTNKGRKTKGIDNILFDTPAVRYEAVYSLSVRRYHPKPALRKAIPKGKGKVRMLSIPTMQDRAYQTLFKMALSPYAEYMADPHSYGYRPRRCTRDALFRCLYIMENYPGAEWVLQADIESCFDNISHAFLMEKIPMDKKVLWKFLNSGYMENGTVVRPGKGIPQGGSLSPLLCNLTLDGLEQAVEDASQGQAWTIRYADDCTIISTNRQVLAEKVIPAINQFLHPRGLNLSVSKTKICHITDGFEAIGWHIQKHGQQTIVTPSQANAEKLYGKIEDALTPKRSAKDRSKRPLDIVRGWIAHHRDCIHPWAFQEAEYVVTRMVLKMTGDESLVKKLSGCFPQ